MNEWAKIGSKEKILHLHTVLAYLKIYYEEMVKYEWKWTQYTVWQNNPKYIIQASDRMADRTKNRMADLQRKQEESLDALSLTRWRQIDALPDPAARIPYILAIQIVEYCSTERKSSSCRQEQPKTLERFFLVFAHNRGHISTLAVQIKINYTMAVSNICYIHIPTIDIKSRQPDFFVCVRLLFFFLTFL